MLGFLRELEMWLFGRSVTVDIERDTRSAARVGQVVRVHVRNHNQVKAEHIGGPLFHFGREETPRAIGEGEDHGPKALKKPEGVSEL